MNTDNAPLLLRETKKNIAFLTLNRPSRLNALNQVLLQQLKEELASIRDSQTIEAVVLTGAGERAFSAGADIAYLNQASPLEVRELARLAVQVTTLFENLGKPSVALINGFALGGGLELAESCMMRIAVNSSKMGHPEVRIGAVAGWGGTTRLPRLIGKGRATQLLLTGEMIDAETALQWGLVNRVVEATQLQSAGISLLEEILQNAPVATRLSWEAIHRGLDIPIEESTRLGTDYFGLIASTEDFRRGTKGFLDKKKVRFEGK